MAVRLAEGTQTEYSANASSKIGYCLNENTTDADTKSFIEMLAERDTFPTVGLLFYTPFLFSYNLCQIVWFIVLMDAFFQAFVKILEKNKLRKSCSRLATFIVLYCSCHKAFNSYISVMYFQF